MQHHHNARPIAAAVGLTLLASLLLTQAGCLGVVANLVHAVGADRVPALHKDLHDCRLAIVTVTDSSQYSDDISARILSRRVGEILSQELDDVELVREDQIEQWRDTNGWDAIDYLSIGRGVNADKVLAIELTDMRLRDGPTLYRGRAAVRIQVIDVKQDRVSYSRDLDEFTYPTSAGQYSAETTEPRFRKLYLSMLAKQVARTFHPYDFSDYVAIDGAIASQ